MKRIDLGITGSEIKNKSRPNWEDLIQDPVWEGVVKQLVPNSFPTDIQTRTLDEGALLSTRRNLILTAPTNSGKSLLAYLLLLRGALTGKRALLLVPLRAIAQEKFEELQEISRKLEPVLNKKVGVVISTGDYRLNEETLQSPPPEDGELVVATPERIECIIRNTEFDTWTDSIGVVCADEAHLIGDKTRGATLEYVITSMKCLSVPPQILLMSATLGNTEVLEKWIEPCTSIMSNIREPALHQWAIEADENDDSKEEVVAFVKEILSDSKNSLLIFVYQISWTNSLARDLNDQLGNLCGTSGAKPYHSRLSSASKNEIRHQFMDGDCRCVVTTAALAMGVNLPATHVLVRDLSYGLDGSLTEGGLLQMAGRAGRGSMTGQAFFLCKPNGFWNSENLNETLNKKLETEVRSTLIPLESGFNNQNEIDPEPPLAKPILSLLSRKSETGLKIDEINNFLNSTLAGLQSNLEVEQSLNWMVAPSRILIFEENDIFKPTTLGNSIIRSSLPLSTGTGIATLFRDIFSTDSSDRHLSEITNLDILILCELVSSKKGIRTRRTSALEEGVDRWMEQMGNPSVFYKTWIRGDEIHSKAEEFLGSLIHNQQFNKKDARSFAYFACFQAIILWQRANGTSVQDIETRWGKSVHGLEEYEESWRDDRLFLISAMLNMWDLRVFYFHLKNDCDAKDTRILRIKKGFKRLNTNSFQILDLVGWCSPLGPIFSRLRSSLGSSRKGNPAKGTMKKLEDQGINSIEILKSLDLEDYVKLGIRKDFASKIMNFSRKI